MVVLGSLVGEWLSMLYFKLAENGFLWLSRMWVTDWACFVLKLAENYCLWLSRRWVTVLALFSGLLKMVALGSQVCEWLGLFCFSACWNWLSLALQRVSDWDCFIFKPAENNCPWHSRRWVTRLALSSSLLKMGLSRLWVTGLALFSGLLKMVILGFPGGEWLLHYFQLVENGCPWLSSMWVTGLALFSSLLKMVVLYTLGGEWLGLLDF